MAPKKKKSKLTSKKIVIPAVAISIVILVITFPTLVGILEVNPFYNKDNFGVPELSVQDQQSNDEINKMIDGALGLPLELCALSPAELDEIEQCDELAKDEVLVEIDPDDPDFESFTSCGLTQAQFDECTSEISDIIKDLQDQLLESEIPTNDTEFSDDPPDEQLCDLTECPEASAVVLETSITKITSDGTRIDSTETFDLPLQSFFVEDISNIDYRNGFVEVSLVAVTNPDVKLSGSGELDVLIGGNSVLQNPFPVTVQSGNNTDGRVQLLIGGVDRIKLSIGNFFNLFPDRTATTFEIRIINIEFTDERNIFLNQDFEIFAIDFFRDDVNIIIIDEEGNPTRSYPMDSRIVIHSSASKSEPYQLCTTRIDTFESRFKGNGLGCSSHTLIASTAGGCSAETTGQIPAPTISGISLKDSDDNILATGSGSGNSLFDFNELTRNATYTISTSQAGSSELDYGQAQETKSFTCTQEGTAILGSSTRISGSTAICQTYYRITSQSLAGFDLGAITCNFP